jgi:hypothetical protein
LTENLYRVRDWNEHYENNRSRVISDLTWVPIPNSHDGEGYCILMAHSHAAEIFAAWILILQVASRCHPRGTLMRDNGTPLTPSTLAMRTRGKTEWFEMAMPILLEIGWLTLETTMGLKSDARVTFKCRPGDEEGKEGIEGKEEKEARAEKSSGEIPSVSEVIGCAMATNKAIPADYCREFHAKKTEKHQWLSNGRLVLWESQLGRYWETDKQNWGKKKNANNISNGRKSSDRNRNTINEGKASQYRGVGSVPPVGLPLPDAK